jgi:5'-nucleotidase
VGFVPLPDAAPQFFFKEIFMRRVLMPMVLAAFVMLVSSAGARAFELTVVHVNDTHSHLEPCPAKLSFDDQKTYVKLGGWDRLKTKVDAVRAKNPNVALLHAGDAVQGTLYFTKYLGKPEMEFMNLLGFDAMVLGNHEFDKGPDVLAHFLKYAHFPVLCANLRPGAESALADEVRPYVILEFNGERVGVIGLTLEETRVISRPAPATFADAFETAKQCVAELEGKGVNKIIALTHMGYDADKKLAASVAGIDLVVGGHSHTLLDDGKSLAALGLHSGGPYPTRVTGPDGSDVYVVTSWKWAMAVGVLRTVFDDAGHVTECGGNAVLLLSDSFQRKNGTGEKVELQGADRNAVMDAVVKSPMAEVVGPDADADALLAPYKKGLESMRNEVIGRAAQSLPHIRVPGVTESDQDLPQGSMIAPIVCDSMLWKAQSVGLKPDLALQNGGGVRTGVERGPITVGTAYTLMPFGNTLMVLDLKGAQVQKALENGATRQGGAFAYVAGARYTVDMNRPEGERVTSVDIRRGDRWEALDSEATYRMVTISYLADGGDDYQVLKNAVGHRYDTGFVDAQVFMDYVRMKKTLQRPESTGITFIPAN